MALHSRGPVGRGCGLARLVSERCYCSPTWVSDYTYKALYNRIKIINGALAVRGPMKGYRWALVDEKDAILSIGPRFTGDLPPGGEPKTIAGKSGWFYPYDHLLGGQLLVPDP